MHKNTTLLQLSLSANTSKMNPLSDKHFQAMPPNVYAHGHLPLPQMRQLRNARPPPITSEGRRGEYAALRCVPVAGASGEAGPALIDVSDHRWDFFYVRMCQMAGWESVLLSGNENDHGATGGETDEAEEKEAQKETVASKSKSPPCPRALFYSKSLHSGSRAHMELDWLFQVELLQTIKRLKALRLIDLSQNAMFDRSIRNGTHFYRAFESVGKISSQHRARRRDIVARLRQNAWPLENIESFDSEGQDEEENEEGDDFRRDLIKHRNMSGVLTVPMNKEKGLSIARMPKRLYDETVTQEQLAMCGLDPTFYSFQTDLSSAPGRAQANAKLGLMPLRYECKIAFLMVRLQLSKPRRLSALDAERLSLERPFQVPSARTTNRAADTALKEGDLAPPSAIRLLSASVVVRIFSMLHEPRAICLSPDASLITEPGFA